MVDTTSLRGSNALKIAENLSQDHTHEKEEAKDQEEHEEENVRTATGIGWHHDIGKIRRREQNQHLPGRFDQARHGTFYREYHHRKIDVGFILLKILMDYDASR